VHCTKVLILKSNWQSLEFNRIRLIDPFVERFFARLNGCWRQSRRSSTWTTARCACSSGPTLRPSFRRPAPCRKIGLSTGARPRAVLTTGTSKTCHVTDPPYDFEYPCTCLPRAVWLEQISTRGARTESISVFLLRFGTLSQGLSFGGICASSRDQTRAILELAFRNCPELYALKKKLFPRVVW
jgi:hypothetical protein